MMYCIYLRKSRRDIEAEQRGEGETLARHRAMLTELAARRGLPIGRIYHEIVSGDTISDRPVMQELLRDVQAGKWAGVLVAEIERLARGDTIDQGIVAQAFKFSGTHIITPTRDYDPDDEADEEYFEFGLFMSRREYKTTRRRLQAGRLASVKEGKYMGTRPPFGYERYKLKGEKGWSLRIVPEKAEIVRMIFSLYLRGRDITVNGQTVHEDMGAQKIANLLRKMGLKTDLGNEWTADKVRKLLQDVAYIGKVQWYQKETKIRVQDGQRVKSRQPSDRHIVVDGRHAAIIDMDTWNAVQTAFAHHQKGPVKAGTPMRSPFNGLVKCGICGKAMIRTPMYGHMAGIDHLKCSTVGCPTSSAPVADVERLVLDGLREWLDGVTVAPIEAPEPDALPREAMEKHLDDLNRRRARLMDLLEQGVYDIPTYTERAAILARDIESARAAMDSMAEAPVRVEDAVYSILPELRHVLQAYDVATSNEAKNALLRAVLDKIIYHKTYACKRGEKACDYLSLELFPRIKK